MYFSLSAVRSLRLQPLGRAQVRAHIAPSEYYYTPGLERELETTLEAADTPTVSVLACMNPERRTSEYLYLHLPSHREACGVREWHATYARTLTSC